MTFFLSLVVYSIIVSKSLCFNSIFNSMVPRFSKKLQPLFAATQESISLSVPTSTAIKYTGSNGAALELDKVCLSVGNNDIMNDVNWTMMPNERWGLVGRNGAGKSTLLRALTNTGGETVAIRTGLVSIAKKARMGYLEQKGVSGSKLTVREEVTSRMDRLRLATKNLESIELR